MPGPARPGDRRLVPDREREEFIRLVREEWTNAQLSEHFGIHTTTVDQRIQTWGLTGLREANKGKGSGGTTGRPPQGAAGSPYGFANSRTALDRAVALYWRNRAVT